MSEEQPVDETVEENTSDQGTAQPERMSQAVRRERLTALATTLGEHAQQDGDVIVIEAGEPVVLHIELDREGEYTLTWWATALTEHGHHRWRDVASELLRDGETISTSALGGGYLVEIVQTSRDEAAVIELSSDANRVERVRELMRLFPEGVAALPSEPIPEYLVPPEPELPPLGEAEPDPEADDDSEEYTANS